jgi:hypothetical protein
MPLAIAVNEGRVVHAVYQVFGKLPVHDAAVHFEGEVIGLTLRAQIPSEPIVLTAWPFACVEIPLPRPAGGRVIKDDSRHRYPGSESGIENARARQIAHEILDRTPSCPRLSPDRVAVR